MYVVVFEARVIKWTNPDSENATYEERLENMENRTYIVDILHTFKVSFFYIPYM